MDVPSLEREAASAAALFLIQKCPSACREFIEFMRQQGELARQNHRNPSAGGRVRAGYQQWADWMARNLQQAGLKPEESSPPVHDDDPLEKALLGSTSKFTPTRIEGVLEIKTRLPDEELSEEALRDLDKAIEEDTRKKRVRSEFVLAVCQYADLRLAAMCENRTEKLSKLVSRPTIFTNGSEHKAVVVQSFTVTRDHKTVKHDLKANGTPITVRHPDMLVQTDQQKLIRSKVITPKREEFYVKVLEYRDGMIFKGYFEVAREDKEDQSVYFQVRGDEVVQIDEKTYREAENYLAAGRNPVEVTIEEKRFSKVG